MAEDAYPIPENVQELILDAYSSIEYNELRKKLSQTTNLELMKKGRDETTFSSLLEWIFGNPNFNTTDQSPILFLLRLLALNAEKQGNANEELMKNWLNDLILDENIVINNVSAKTEVPTFPDNSKKRDGSIDLVLKCTVKDKHGKLSGKHLRIFIENKVDSDEHDEQCRKYFKYFDKHGVDGIDKKNLIDIYVFLSIDAPGKLSDTHFIKITYQELLDRVLTLIMLHHEECEPTQINLLKDFINTITSLKTKKGNKTVRNIAMDKTVEDRLKNFYKEHQELINAAVLVGCSDPIVKNAIKRSQRSTAKYELYYNGNPIPSAGDKLPMYRVASEALKKLCGLGKTPEEIEDYLINFKYHNTFWQLDEGQDPTSAYGDEVINRATGKKYYINTNIYDQSTFEDLMGILSDIGFSYKVAKK